MHCEVKGMKPMVIVTLRKRLVLVVTKFGMGTFFLSKFLELDVVLSMCKLFL
jgi:hypothetical protein